MESIIEKLFYDALEKPIKEENLEMKQKENEIYEKIKGLLNDEQKNLLLDFDDIKSERCLRKEKYFYTLGFQAGAQTVLEILNINFCK